MEQPTLKSLTWELHKQAEQTPLMMSLLNNTISQSCYCDLIFTKYQIYSRIEQRIRFKTPGLDRAQLALNDMQNMGCHMPPLLSELTLMLDHLGTLSESDLWAHVYVQYLAPLYGGQIIKKTIQHRFSTLMYDFSHPHESKQEIRSHLTVDMAAEANRSFSMTIAYYNQLWSLYDPSN
jgi:heme oxygenase